MTAAAPAAIGDLPDFYAAAGDDWPADLMATASRLMDAGVTGLLRTGPDTVVAFRYHDVRQLSVAREAGNLPIGLLAAASASRDPGAAVVGTAARSRAVFQMLADQAFTHNPPLHKHTRRALSRQILRHRMAGYEALAGDIVSDLLAGLRGRSDIDFAADVARPYLARFWGAVIGLPAGQADEVGALMTDLDRMFRMQRAPGDAAVIDRAAERYVEIVTASVVRSRAGAGSPFVAEMAADLAAIEVEGKPQSAGSFVAANLFDGFHTVGVALANAVYVLVSAGEYDRLGLAPELVPRAFAEALRIAPPLLITHRYALAGIEHDGVTLPAGTMIAMLWGSPGYDPGVFEAPEQFR
ncbi:MAG TPA: cytochrome P450, partial [Streptosporangiaceae bacterium]